MENLKKIIDNAISQNAFPAISLIASKNYKLQFQIATGKKDTLDHHKTNLNSIFDLASLTKALFTTLCTLYAIREKKISLNTKIADIILEFKNTDKEDITIRELLTHQSGLPAHKKYYQNLSHTPFHNRKKFLKTILINQEISKKKETIYSDIGFMILFWGLENIFGNLEIFAQKEIYKKLALESLHFPKMTKQKAQTHYLPTEFCKWRNKLICGQVHDQNTYAIGGVCGQAGLFGSANDIHELLLEILKSYHQKQRFFDQKIICEFLNTNGKRALGFDIPSEKNSLSGQFFSQNSVGHLGFTGVSFWMDLNEKIIIIMLTNRICPNSDNDKINIYRPLIHDEIMKKLL